MSDSCDFGEYKRRLNAAQWIDVVAEGDNWIAFDEPGQNRRAVSISYPDRVGFCGADVLLSSCGEDAPERIYRHAIAVLATKGLEQEAREAFGAFG